MKKIIYCFGLMIFIILLILGLLYFSIPNNSTVNFRGIVNEITVDNDNNTAHIKATIASDNTPTNIIVNGNIAITDFYKNKITIYDIHIGDSIDLDYSGNINDTKKPINAKRIMVNHMH